MNKENAESIAHKGIAYLAEDDTLLWRFLDLTGITPMNLRAASEDPAFLCAVMEFYLTHEPTLLAFAGAKDIDPAEISNAAAVLCAPPNPDEAVQEGQDID